VARVPRKAEGTLGLEIIDFGFTRELPEESGHKVPKSGIIVSDDQQPPMKKSKADTSIMPPEANSGPTLSISKNVVGDSGKAVQEAYWSAPPKINFKSRSQTKLLADAQKAYKNCVNEEEEGKIHIPKTFEDSDSESDSDSFTIKVQRLTGMPVNQFAHDDKGQSSTQTWSMENISSNIDGAPGSVGLQKSILDMTLSDGGKDTKTCQVTTEILVEVLKKMTLCKRWRSRPPDPLRSLSLMIILSTLKRVVRLGLMRILRLLELLTLNKMCLSLILGWMMLWISLLMKLLLLLCKILMAILRWMA
jgi:hypothetical protein